MGWPYQQKPPMGWPLDYDSGLVPEAGFWPMQESSGNQVQDLSGRNTGTFGAGAASPIWVPGKFGSELSFDGGDYVAAIRVSISGYPFTLFGWCDARTEAVTGSLISISDFSAATVYFVIGYYNNASYGWRFIAVNTDSYQIPAGALTTGMDFIVAVAHSATDRRLYVNGVYIGNSTDSLSWNANIDTLTIGVVGRSSAYSTDMLSGLVPCCGIYNRGLSPSEIALLYREPFCMFKDPAEIALLGGYQGAVGGTILQQITNAYMKASA